MIFDKQKDQYEWNEWTNLTNRTFWEKPGYMGRMIFGKKGYLRMGRMGEFGE